MSRCVDMGFSGFHNLNSILFGQLVKAVLLYKISSLFDFVPQLCEVQRRYVFSRWAKLLIVKCCFRLPIFLGAIVSTFTVFFSTKFAKFYDSLISLFYNCHMNLEFFSWLRSLSWLKRILESSNNFYCCLSFAGSCESSQTVSLSSESVNSRYA